MPKTTSTSKHTAQNYGSRLSERHWCYADADADGFRGEDDYASADADCSDVGEALGTLANGDCDDTNPGANPGATEVVGDEIDEDCNGIELCYEDRDADGYRDDAEVISLDADCADSTEVTSATPSGDCADTNSALHPGATEIVADGIDQDCDGGDVCYTDADGDGYRSEDTVVSVDLECTAAGEAATDTPDGDCDDTDALRFPGADEPVGDEVDGDCDGGERCFADADLDSFRTDTEVVSDDADCADDGEAAFAVADGDCDDADPRTYPGADELLGDEIDEDCNGVEDCYTDADADGYRVDTLYPSDDVDCADEGEASSAVPGTDCNDDEAEVNPGATDVAGDGVDQDCSGSDEPADAETPGGDGGGEDAGGCGCATPTSPAGAAATLLTGLRLVAARRRRTSPR